MAHLRRASYTKPIPGGASIITRDGKPHARFKNKAGRTVEAPLTEKGDRIVLYSRKWHGEYIDADGVPQCVALDVKDKTAALQLLAALELKAEKRRANIFDPFELHRKRPLAEHLAAWQTALESGRATASHAARMARRVQRILDGCDFATLDHLLGVGSASRVQEYVAGLCQQTKSLPAMPDGTDFSRKQLAALLGGLKLCSVTALMRQHGLPAIGSGKARRYPRATVEALRSLRSRGRGMKTSNYYLGAIKQFCRWLVKDRRISDNPLAHLAGGNAAADVRRGRRPLSADELRTVLHTTAQSGRLYRGLDGPARAMLYAVACATGYRASELACLMPAAFDLDGEPPAIVLGAEHTKNGKTAMQPVAIELTDALRSFLADRPTGLRVWPGTWHEKAATMFRRDLDAAGIPYAAEGPDGPLYADFHSLRHSFIALLDKSGATLKEAMQLARHSDPRLTMAVYGRAQRYDLGQVAERMPALLTGPNVEAMAATGTDGNSPTVDGGESPQLAAQLAEMVRKAPADAAREFLPFADSKKRREKVAAEGTKGKRVVSAPAMPVTTHEKVATGPGRDRTCDPGIMSPPVAGCNPLLDKTCGESRAQLAAQLAEISDLARLAASWPELPEHIRAAVLALLDAAAKVTPSAKVTPADAPHAR